jgi:threonyl-tRNA synthetase
MITVTFPDGNQRSYEPGTTAMDVAKSISHGLARNILSGSYDGQTIELNDALTHDGTLQFFTWNDAKGKEAFWHSSAHVLAQAILHFYPNAQLTIGPAIEKGFYYDVDFGDESIGEGDFAKIEKQMLEFARAKSEFKLRPVTKAEALEVYKDNSVQNGIDLEPRRRYDHLL